MSEKKGELVKVPFHGGHVLVVKCSDGERIVVKTICDVLSVDAQAQQRRIDRDPRLKAWTAKMAVRLPGDERTRHVVTIPRKKLAAFLYGIEANMVRDDKIRANLIVLQDELEDVMDAYFAGRAAGASADELLGKLQEMTTALQLQTSANGQLQQRLGLLETQMRTMVSGALRELPRTMAWFYGRVQEIATLRRFGTDLSEAAARGQVQEDLARALKHMHLPWEEFPAARIDDVRQWLYWLHRDARRDAKRRGFHGSATWTQPPLPFIGQDDGDDDDETGGA